MLASWILVSTLLLGVRAFMIHNTQRSLCLEDSAATGEVLLRRCNLYSETQQWIWIDQGMLMCVATSRCLSGVQSEPLRTQSCQGAEVDAAGLMWDCDRNRLISRNTSMQLSVDGRRLVLAHDGKHSRWKSLDKGDICQEKLRSKRASEEPDEFESGKEQKGEQGTMTEEQKEYLRWFYRTEDPTMWKFVLLGLAFICLLVGFMLLGMGAMANKNRKKIAKYKAAAAVAQRSEGAELLPLADNSGSKAPPSPLLRENKPSSSNGDVNELKAGDIVVTWKDGNTSCLYSEAAAEQETKPPAGVEIQEVEKQDEEMQEVEMQEVEIQEVEKQEVEKQEEEKQEEEKQEVVSATELEEDVEEVKTVE